MEGSHSDPVCFVGLQLRSCQVGDGRTWDQVRFNEFPSRRQFMEVVADPRRLKGQEDHRDPAMADTYTLLCRPVLDTLRKR